MLKSWHYLIYVTPYTFFSFSLRLLAVLKKLRLKATYTVYGRFYFQATFVRARKKSYGRYLKASFVGKRKINYRKYLDTIWIL